MFYVVHKKRPESLHLPTIWHQACEPQLDAGRVQVIQDLNHGKFVCNVFFEGLAAFAKVKF